MEPEVQEFIDTWADKTAAKAETLAAIGELRLAEAQGRKMATFAKVIAERGHADGDEGKLQAKCQQIADDFVAAHPEQFAPFEEFTYTDPDAEGLTGQDRIVILIAALIEAGMVEQATKLTMFEMTRFERQNIGAIARPVLRIGGGA